MQLNYNKVSEAGWLYIDIIRISNVRIVAQRVHFIQPQGAPFLFVVEVVVENCEVVAIAVVVCCGYAEELAHVDELRLEKLHCKSFVVVASA